MLPTTSASGSLENHQPVEEENQQSVLPTGGVTIRLEESQEEVDLHPIDPNHPSEYVSDLVLSDDDYSLYSDDSFDYRYYDFAENFEEDFDEAVPSIFDDDDYFDSLHFEDDLFDSPDYDSDDDDGDIRPSSDDDDEDDDIFYGDLTMEIVPYNGSLIVGMDIQKTCSICTDDFVVNGGVAILQLACHHRFHLPCLQPWTARSRTCPLCRRPVNN